MEFNFLNSSKSIHINWKIKISNTYANLLSVSHVILATILLNPDLLLCSQDDDDLLLPLLQ